ncbi:ROK family protein [Streptomyces sp. NPDC002523]
MGDARTKVAFSRTGRETTARAARRVRRSEPACTPRPACTESVVCDGRRSRAGLDGWRRRPDPRGFLCAGPTGDAGHLGHVIAEPDGEPCSCGARGAWRRRRGRRSSRGRCVTVGTPRGRGAATTEAVAESAPAGDPVAPAAFDRAAGAVAAAVGAAGAVANLTEARLAVIGGGAAASATSWSAPSPPTSTASRASDPRAASPSSRRLRVRQAGVRRCRGPGPPPSGPPRTPAKCGPGDIPAGTFAPPHRSGDRHRFPGQPMAPTAADAPARSTVERYSWPRVYA